MNRLMISLSLTVVLALTPFIAAESSTPRSSGKPHPQGPGRHGKIQGVSTTNFSVGVHHHNGWITAFMVHFNPETVSMTLDGVAVKTLDATAAGKYVHVVGVMKNGQMEATHITVTTNPPA